MLQLEPFSSVTRYFKTSVAKYYMTQVRSLQHKNKCNWTAGVHIRVVGLLPLLV